MMTAQRIERTDIHRPSAIQPEDYQWVALECIKIEGIGDCYVIMAERERILEHMAKTGGTYAGHEHGGNCMVCGASAVYTHLFYHAKTNSYIRTGEDCADKLEMGHGDSNLFRKQIKEARKNVAGKRKAQALLADRGLVRCWDIYAAPYPSRPIPDGTRFSTEDDRHGSYIGDVIQADGSPLTTDQEQAARDLYWEHARNQKPYDTIRDIVGKLVKYGSISDRQSDFLHNLLQQIDNRPAMEAARKAEQEMSADCPEGRIDIDGTVVSIKTQESDFGPRTCCLVKHDSGYKVWGTLPSFYELDDQGRVTYLEIKAGHRVQFKATVTRSAKDPKFGIYKRPTTGTLISS